MRRQRKLRESLLKVGERRIWRMARSEEVSEDEGGARVDLGFLGIGTEAGAGAKAHRSWAGVGCRQEEDGSGGRDSEFTDLSTSVVFDMRGWV
ncbi:uncharacterized protein A4U43_C05F10270 [Asparagus officinalis]|uniref:Uncharacterized protein n=1 Tax=Asparagus officinalis TaxID=4686 RepID=A0A5P1EQP4_ASPOF|nr:uncharacterized protein A4U43_C05F10270 [Asparagus officinalis]